MTTLGPYSALGHTFEIDVVDGDDPRLAELLAPLAWSGPVEHTYLLSLPTDDEPGWIEDDGDRIAVNDLGTAHDRLLLRIGQGVLRATSDPVVHGCVVDLDGRGVLVSGPSGAGKSTLTARLASEGGALVAEDLTTLDASGRVRPFHRPLALSATSLEALGLPVPEDDCGCGCMKHLLAPGDLGGRFGGPIGVELVVFCRSGGTDVTDLTLAEALARLFVDGGIGNVTQSSRLAAVASALAGARCVVLGTADLDHAVGSVRALLDADRPAVTVAAEPAEGGAIVYLDGEALIHVDGMVHHLDPAATAVWVLHTEGLSDDEVAAELGWERELVGETVERLRALELPAPTR